MVIDFSDDNIQEYHLDNDPSNDTFKEFMKLEKPEWVACRWIAVNGLSWYVDSPLFYHTAADVPNPNAISTPKIRTLCRTDS